VKTEGHTLACLTPPYQAGSPPLPGLQYVGLIALEQLGRGLFRIWQMLGARGAGACFSSGAILPKND